MISTVDTAENPVARGSIALVGTLVAGSIGLTAGVTMALLLASLLWMP